ncbi:REP-associated tyrosine transposase [Hahella ganghwensis]|uniref:REP-associated tyrosine transposase n=1 Tax=Hahella ganghwensis TaxID=286420 RepID=UPI00035F5E6C|nr:transposase [Hahella ganghwensis]
MARKPRVHTAGITQHIVQRGHNRERCFFNEQCYRFYLRVAREMAEQEACEVHAYVLMTNHVHLLVTPQKNGALSRMMKRINERYGRFVNYEFGRTGSVWEGRFKASVIDTEKYLLTCYRYIEMNPVRAGLVKRPSEYLWSSARWHGWGEKDELVVDHSLYIALGRSPEERQRAYRALFAEDLK